MYGLAIFFIYGLEKSAHTAKKMKKKCQRNMTRELVNVGQILGVLQDRMATCATSRDCQKCQKGEN